MADRSAKVAKFETSNPNRRISVSVSYTEGGRSLSGDSWQDRGYLCNVHGVLVHKLDGEGGHDGDYETIKLGEGGSFELETAKRFSQKKLDELAKMVQRLILYPNQASPQGKLYLIKYNKLRDYLLAKLNLTLGKRIFPE